MIALAGLLVLGQVMPTQKMATDVPLITNVTSAVLQVPSEVDGGVPTPVEMGEGVCMNEVAHQRLNTGVNLMAQHIDRVDAENLSLKNQVDAIAADPPTPVKPILIAGGVSLVVGAVMGAIVYGVLKK